MECRLSDPALKHCPLHCVSNETRGNKEIALIVCRRVGLALELVSDALKDDSKLVLEVCHQNGWALQFASCKPQAVYRQIKKLSLLPFLSTEKH